MTSLRRIKKSGPCPIQSLDWDSPSVATGTVKRRSSCPEDSKKSGRNVDAVFDETPSDSGSGTSRSVDDDKSDGLIDVEERISSMINENRSSQSNSDTSDVDIIFETILENPIDVDLIAQNNLSRCDSSKTVLKSENTLLDSKNLNIQDGLSKSREKRLSNPINIKKLNKNVDVKSGKASKLGKLDASVLPVYKSTVQENTEDLSNVQKKRNSKLKLPFSPVKTMDKPKINFFQGKATAQESKPSPLLSSPVRRTISNEYVRLKFNNDTVIRRTIGGKSVQKITPKIQSIIPESPIDNEDPFLNLSPNKKYTVTVNNKVRCDKDNYVIFDPYTGFKSDEGIKQSRLLSKAGDRSKIPLKSPVGEKLIPPKTLNVSDTDSGILSPNSPGEASEKGSAHYVNAAVFSASAKKCASALDVTILDPAVAKKATEQIKYPHPYPAEGGIDPPRGSRCSFLTRAAALKPAWRENYDRS
ncbi:hypothetical protein KGM_204487 [Danaus plexippus plexippus]|uniref:Uncharacterized protein n=1 Tax=Danaus plexippus plexippus TaxID=278856 RepID=A0A212FKX3_DANPL|nr:hypothetical protein KGM_204487 [Danaus plexippus plexippus]